MQGILLHASIGLTWWSRCHHGSRRRTIVANAEMGKGIHRIILWRTHDRGIGRLGSHLGRSSVVHRLLHIRAALRLLHLHLLLLRRWCLLSSLRKRIGRLLGLHSSYVLALRGASSGRRRLLHLLDVLLLLSLRGTSWLLHLCGWRLLKLIKCSKT